MSIPEDMQTGTGLDDYMQLMQAVMMYYQGLVEFDNDRRELKRAVKDFEKNFQPGTEQGVCDSLFVPWYLFDLRFGKSGKTVCERFLEDSSMKKVGEPAFSLIRHMSESYTTFYEVANITDEIIEFIELGTGIVWHINDIHDPERNVIKGDIWFVRFVGPSDNAYEFSAPYIFPSDAKEDLSRAVIRHFDETSKALNGPIGHDSLFRESCKAALPGWADYMLYSSVDYDDEIPDEELIEPFMPELHNTDGELIRLCKIVFKIIDETETKAGLNSMKSFNYDKKNKMWIWFKKGNKQISTFSTTSLGTLTIKRGKLIGETNSEERAEKIVKKLKKELQGFVVFEKIEVKDLDKLLSPNEKEKKQSEAINKEVMKKTLSVK